MEPMATKPLRILVVDDCPDTAGMMKLLLKRWGHEVKTALDGTGALEAARQFRPDAVLLDLRLPDKSGFEVAEELGVIPELRGCILVAVSGHGQDEDHRRSKEAGFDHHLTKPLDHEALLTLLASG
jgi:two-component system CheB/CheR fusion protein